MVRRGGEERKRGKESSGERGEKRGKVNGGEEVKRRRKKMKKGGAVMTLKGRGEQ